MSQFGKLNRRECISLAAASLLSYSIHGVNNSFGGIDNVTGQNKAVNQHQQERKKLARRKRRIIMNNDGNDLCKLHGVVNITPTIFLAKRTYPLIATQVDSIFYCTGVFDLYTHQSSITEFNDRGTAGLLYKQLVEKFNTDSLSLIIEFARKYRKEVFWSMRMNDTHDSFNLKALSTWKNNHMPLLMGTPKTKFKYGEKRWSALNYEHRQVRQKVLEIIKDLVTHYDVDGVELDFFRHPVYFKQQLLGEKVTQKQCDLITSLLGEILTMLKNVGYERGHPVLLSVRVPDSIQFSKSIGLDIVQWLELQLVDLVVMGGYFRFHNWDRSVELGKRYDVPMYACLETGRIQADPRGGIELKKWRCEAIQAWNAGMDGIYTFNAFNPTSLLYKELGSPSLLKTLARAKFVSGINPNFWTNPGKWLKNGNDFIRFDAAEDCVSAVHA